MHGQVIKVMYLSYVTTLWLKASSECLCGDNQKDAITEAQGRSSC